MTLGDLIALICIIIGFIVGLFSADIGMKALEWFVAAIAIDLTIDGPTLFTWKRGE